MSRLAAALERLDKAVTALEKAGSETALAAEDRKRLAGELTAARTEYEALAQATDKVSTRLDSTIGRLRTVLEG